MLTYTEAAQELGNKTGKKIGNNTRLERFSDERIDVVLHFTSVVKLFSDNTFELSSGGWQTVTTKSRINEYSPARVFQKDFNWFVRDIWGTDWDFKDGMKVNQNGSPIK